MMAYIAVAAPNRRRKIRKKDIRSALFFLRSVLPTPRPEPRAPDPAPCAMCHELRAPSPEPPALCHMLCVLCPVTWLSLWVRCFAKILLCFSPIRSFCIQAFLELKTLLFVILLTYCRLMIH